MDPTKKELASEDVEIQTIESEEEDSESSPPEYRISCNPADLTLESLHSRWMSKELLIPGFQRKFVWKQPQSSKLIESFLHGLPVPSIFLYRERDEKHSVIDGQQRLKSVFYFFEGLFGEENVVQKRTVFRLKGLHKDSRFVNKTYTELSEPDQRRLRNSVLRAFIIDQLDPDDNTSIFHIFERLNTGGTQLKPQEVRNCVYWGEFNNAIIDMNMDHNWRLLMGRSGPDSRLKDVELVLRFFALRDDLDTYDRPMKDFLSSYMRRHRNPPPAFVTDHLHLFQSTSKALVSNLGPRAFHILAGLNVAVLDSVAVAFSKHLPSISSDVKKRFEHLVQDKDYRDLVTGPTADVSNVRDRMKTAEHTLFD